MNTKYFSENESPNIFFSYDPEYGYDDCYRGGGRDSGYSTHGQDYGAVPGGAINQVIKYIFRVG